jgi:hypothetical protein
MSQLSLLDQQLPGSTTSIVGTNFKGSAAVELIGALKRGTRLELRREPDNRYDRNAVGVYFSGQHLGYVPRSDNRELAFLLDHRPSGSLTAELTLEAVVGSGKVKFPPRIRIHQAGEAA